MNLDELYLEEIVKNTIQRGKSFLKEKREMDKLQYDMLMMQPQQGGKETITGENEKKLRDRRDGADGEIDDEGEIQEDQQTFKKFTIQSGPVINIQRALTVQNMRSVHISPECSVQLDCNNVAVYDVEHKDLRELKSLNAKGKRLLNEDQELDKVRESSGNLLGSRVKSATLLFPQYPKINSMQNELPSFHSNALLQTADSLESLCLDQLEIGDLEVALDKSNKVINRIAKCTDELSKVIHKYTENGQVALALKPVVLNNVDTRDEVEISALSNNSTRDNFSSDSLSNSFLEAKRSLSSICSSAPELGKSCFRVNLQETAQKIVERDVTLAEDASKAQQYSMDFTEVNSSKSVVEGNDTIIQVPSNDKIVNSETTFNNFIDFLESAPKISNLNDELQNVQAERESEIANADRNLLDVIVEERRELNDLDVTDSSAGKKTIDSSKSTVSNASKTTSDGSLTKTHSKHYKKSVSFKNHQVGNSKKSKSASISSNDTIADVRDIELQSIEENCILEAPLSDITLSSSCNVEKLEENLNDGARRRISTPREKTQQSNDNSARENEIIDGAANGQEMESLKLQNGNHKLGKSLDSTKSNREDYSKEEDDRQVNSQFNVNHLLLEDTCQSSNFTYANIICKSTPIAEGEKSKPKYPLDNEERKV